MYVLVTRPAEDAATLLHTLEARGHQALLAPLLSIAPNKDLTGPPELTGVQALLFTSANGVRAFAGLSTSRSLPVFTVGDASTAAARQAGFARVESAGGDVADLARLAAERLEPGKGALFHGVARKVAGDLKGLLEGRGFTVRRDVLYEAVAASVLPKQLLAALGSGKLDVATFFSPRTAEIFVTLVRDADLESGCTRTVALALSEAVADKLRVLSWAGVVVAERPNEEALIARLDSIAS